MKDISPAIFPVQAKRNQYWSGRLKKLDANEPPFELRELVVMAGHVHGDIPKMRVEETSNARVQRPPANALKCALYRSRSACNEMLGHSRNTLMLRSSIYPHWHCTSRALEPHRLIEGHGVPAGRNHELMKVAIPIEKSLEHLPPDATALKLRQNKHMRKICDKVSI
jgi:hypothetical protein